MTNLSATSQYSNSPAQPAGSVLTRKDFLARVDAVSRQIKDLKQSTNTLNELHIAALASTSPSSAQIESLEAQIQSTSRELRDAIKYLQADAARTHNEDTSTKKVQVDRLKNSFEARLKEYQQEERSYIRNYQERIKRDYRTVNPNATEEEVNQAADMDWGNEGVFQAAVSHTLPLT
jgi:syntaxin 1B/2/3